MQSHTHTQTDTQTHKSKDHLANVDEKNGRLDQVSCKAMIKAMIQGSFIIAFICEEFEKFALVVDHVTRT